MIFEVFLLFNTKSLNSESPKSTPKIILGKKKERPRLSVSLMKKTFVFPAISILLLR